MSITASRGSNSIAWMHRQTPCWAGIRHSVRAAYLYTGMADVAALTGDASYVQAIDTIWKDVVDTKLYITGGIGAAGGLELAVTILSALNDVVPPTVTCTPVITARLKPSDSAAMSYVPSLTLGKAN